MSAILRLRGSTVLALRSVGIGGLGRGTTVTSLLGLALRRRLSITTIALRLSSIRLLLRLLLARVALGRRTTVARLLLTLRGTVGVLRRTTRVSVLSNAKIARIRM